MAAFIVSRTRRIANIWRQAGVRPQMAAFIVGRTRGIAMVRSQAGVCPSSPKIGCRLLLYFSFVLINIYLYFGTTGLGPYTPKKQNRPRVPNTIFRTLRTHTRPHKVANRIYRVTNYDLADILHNMIHRTTNFGTTGFGCRFCHKSLD